MDSKAAPEPIAVLIVDSDVKAREQAKSSVLDLLPNAKITEATNSHEAIPRVGKQKFHLVFCEFEIPRAGSSTLIDEMNRLPAESRPSGVIVGIPQKLEVGKIKQVHLMTKPFDAGILMAAVNDVLAPVIEEQQKSKPVGSWDDMVNQPASGATKLQPQPKPQPAAAAPAAKAAPKANIDVNFINPFLEGAVTVIESISGIKADREKIFSRASDTIKGDISAVIAMNSSTNQGSFAICFEKSCFLGVANAMLGEAFTEINDDNRDVAGEVCNQIFGYAKRKLNNEQGYDIKPAIPSVISGPGHEIKHLINGIVIAAKFNTPNGWFIVEAAMNS